MPDGIGPIAHRECGPIGQTKSRGVRFGQCRGVLGDVEPDAEGGWELGQQRQQQAAGAGAEIEYAARRWTAGEGGKRGFDQGFRVGTGD